MNLLASSSRSLLFGNEMSNWFLSSLRKDPYCLLLKPRVTFILSIACASSSPFISLRPYISVMSSEASSFVIPHRLEYDSSTLFLRRSCCLFPTLRKGWILRVLSACAALCCLLCFSFCCCSLHFLSLCPPRFFLILVRFPFVRLSLRAIVATPVVTHSHSLSLSLSRCLLLSLAVCHSPTLFAPISWRVYCSPRLLTILPFLNFPPFNFYTKKMKSLTKTQQSRFHVLSNFEEKKMT